MMIKMMMMVVVVVVVVVAVLIIIENENKEQADKWTFFAEYHELHPKGVLRC